MVVASMISRAKSKSVRTCVMEITPDIAAEWLSKNDNNRRVRADVVSNYARQMAAGEWVLNGEAIVFDEDGVLADGQHRLHAVIESGATIQALVVEGVAPAAYITIDSGLGRTMGDVLSVDGELNYNRKAALLRLLWRYEHGMWANLYRGGGGNGHGRTPSHTELRELLSRHPNLDHSINVSAHTSRFLQPSLGATLHYLFSQKDPELADLFYNALAEGTGVMRDEPVYLLRERLIHDRTGKGRLKASEVHALMVKAWNATRKGERVKRLGWINSGPKAEAFPVIE